MCPVRIDRVIPVWICLLLAIGADPGAVRADPVEQALRDAGLFDVLEARLLDSLGRAERDSDRDAIIERLAGLYETRMRDQELEQDQRGQMLIRAWALVDSVGPSRAVGLRLALLLEDYLPIERASELHELGLLSEADRRRDAARLRELHTRFTAMARSAVTEAAAAQRRTGAGSDDTQIAARRRSYRDRSLTNYYAGWSGLTLAVLEDAAPGPEVLRAFGWLLGSNGEIPRLDDVARGSIELEHVARSAIGVGRTRARSGEWLLSEQWLRLVAESEQADPGVRSQAAARLIRLKADQGFWRDVSELISLSGSSSDDEPLPVTEARYLAMRAMPDAARNDQMAQAVARIALAALITRGEIGHVLDLRDRYGSVGLLGTGFVGLYAAGLDRLDEAESAGTPGLYRSAAADLLKAAGADDAHRFPLQRDDARLKAAYAEIRAGHPRPAHEILRMVLGEPSGPAAEEEALWLLIIAIDELADPAERSNLVEAVRNYLARFPGTPRAARLLVRHAGTGLLDPEAAADGLRAIAEDDPVVIDGRRVLVRLIYRGWAEGRRSDREARSELVRLIEWVWSRQGPGDERTRWRERLDTDRIAMDVALGAEPVRVEMARQAIERAEQAVRQEPALEVFRDELTLRRAETAAAAGDLREAADAADALNQAASRHAQAADRVVLSAVFIRLEREPDDTLAGRIGVRIGARVCGEMIPPAPQRLGSETSRVVERVWRLAAALAETESDDDMLALAARLARVVLDRGMPTAQGLRETAALAERIDDPDAELSAWAALLGASKDEEPAWWEARYHSLRLMLEIDPGMARRAYEQHKVLYPMPGLLPWTVQIDELFRTPPNGGPADGGLP